MRIPKLRGFKNRGKIVYEVVNVGDIASRIEAGAFAEAGTAPQKGEQLTINADVLRAVGLVRDVRKPLKVLGDGELSTALFVVADAFTKSATRKIEAAGGAVSVLEVPADALPAIGVGEGARPARVPRTAAGRADVAREANAREVRAADAVEAAAAAATAPAARPEKTPDEPAPTRKRAPRATESADETATPKATKSAPTVEPSDRIEAAEPTSFEAAVIDAQPTPAETTATAAETPVEATDADESSTEAETDSAVAGDESA
jgi:hypothetical protein